MIDRRRIPVVALSVVLILSALVSAVALGPGVASAAGDNSTAGSWYSVQKDAEHSGYEPAPTGLWAGGTLAWNVTPPTGYNVQETPLVVDGSVIVTDNDVTVHSIDVETGAIEWSTKVCGLSSFNPVTDGERVYVTCDSTDDVVAVDLATGSIAWEKTRTDLENETSWDTVYNTHRVTAYGGTVYVEVQAYSDAVGTSQYYLAALDNGTGAVGWISSANPAVNGSSITTNVVADDGTLYYFSGSGDSHYVHAVHAGNGTQIWQENLTDDGYGWTHSQLSLGNDRLYYVGSECGAQSCPGGHRLFGYDLNSRSMVVNASTDRDWFRAPDHLAVTGSAVYYSTEDHQVVAHNASTGAKLWAAEIIASGTDDGGPIVVDDTVFATSSHSGMTVLYAFDALTGEERWTEGYDWSTFGPLAFDGDTDTLVTVGQQVAAFTAVGPSDELAVSPYDYDFGGVKLGENATREFVVKNVGDGDLNVTIPATVDEDGWSSPTPKSFDVTAGAGSFTLASGETRTLSVEFAPEDERTYSGNLSLTHDGASPTTVDVPLAGRGSHCHPVSAPVTISSPGCYELTGDYTNSSVSAGVTIESSDVVLDGRNAVLDGVNGDWSSYGVHVDGSNGALTNVTVTNVTTIGWEVGVRYVDASGSIASVDASDNDDYGIRTIRADGIAVTDSVADSNGYHGIDVASSDGATVTGNVVTNNDYGLRLFESETAHLRNNTMATNRYWEFNVVAETDFPAADEDPTAQFTHDIDRSNTVDGKPIVYEVAPTPGTVIDAGDDPGFVAVVEGDSVTVRDVSLADNGQGVLLVETVDSTVENVSTTDNAYGFLLYNTSTTTLRNVDSSGDFDQGVYVRNGADNAVRNSTVAGVSKPVGGFGDIENGVLVVDSPGVVVADTTVENNGREGIQIASSDGATVLRNTVDGNRNGIDVYGGSDDVTDVTVRDNVVVDSSGTGIELDDVDGALVSNNTVTDGDEGYILTFVSNVTFVNNSAKYVTDSSYGHGIELDDEVADSTFSGNNVSNNRIGFRFEDYYEPTNVSITDNEAWGNDWDVHSTSDYGPVTMTRLDVGTNVSFTGDAEFSLRSLTAAPPADPSGYRNVSHFVETAGPDEESYVNLTFHYADADATNVTESTLSVWSHNGSGWYQAADPSSDATANTVTGNVTTFGVVAPLGRPEGIQYPEIEWSPQSVAFGTQPNGSSATANATVRNVGTGDLNVTSTTITGSLPDTDQFTVVPSTAAPFTLGPGESRNVTVEFAPASAGTYAANLTVGSNDSYRSSIAVALTGTGAIESQLSPANFSVIIDSTNSPVEEYETLSIDVFVENVGDESGTQFVVLGIGGTEVDNQSVTLDGGDSTTITLSYPTDGTDVGQHTAVVSSENVSDSQTVEVTAASGDPDIDLSTTSLEFGYVSVGDDERLNVTVSNVGTATLTVDTIDVVGVDHQHFRVANDDPFSLSPAESRNVTVEFDPWQSGDLLARLDLYSNDPDQSRASVSLSGTTDPDDIVVDGQINTPGGLPAVNDTVALLDQGTQSVVASTTTDGNGDFSLQAPEGATYTLAYLQWDDAGNLGPVDGTPDVFALTTVGGNATVSLTLPTAYETNVTVLRGDTGQPVSDTMVDLYHVNDSARLMLSGSTDAQGRFVHSSRENPGIEAFGVLELHVYSPTGSGLDPNVTSITVDGPTDATVVLQTTDDGDGDDNGTGEVTVNAISVTNGTDSGSTPHVEAWVDEQSMLQLNLRTSEFGDYDLESIGVDDTTEFEIDLTVENFTPRLLLGAGNVTSWERTANGTNATDVTVLVRPVATQSIWECDGGGNCTTPDLNDWPEGANDTATNRTNVTVSMAIDDLDVYPSAQRNALDGTVITTDAQLFGDPTYTPASGGQPATLSLLVGGPHFTVDGTENQGFYDALLPKTLLDAWGITDPENELSAAYDGQPAAFEVTETASGDAKIAIDIHYSAGEVAVSAATDGDDSSSGGSGTSGGSGSSDPGSSEGDEPTSPETTTTPTPTSTTPTSTSTSTPESPTTAGTPTDSDDGTPTPGATQSTQAPPTTSAPGQPGFGLVVTVLALLAALLLAGRRR